MYTFSWGIVSGDHLISVNEVLNVPPGRYALFLFAKAFGYASSAEFAATLSVVQSWPLTSTEESSPPEVSLSGNGTAALDRSGNPLQVGVDSFLRLKVAGVVDYAGETAGADFTIHLVPVT